MDERTSSVRGRPPAMKDVARLAGVSHQTVSRVLNDHPSVSDQTRLRVQAAIRTLGYRRNGAARTLVTGRSQVVGVISQSSTLFGPASMLSAIEQAATAAGFAVSVGSVHSLDRPSVAEAAGRLLDQRVAGIIMIMPVRSGDSALDNLPSDVPVVTIDGDRHRASTLVTVDQVEGARLATRHLLDAGHRTVWHVRGPEDWFDAEGRLEGWRAELEDAGAEIPPVVDAAWTAASGYRAGLMLARMSEVTAVFTANDHLALGVLCALHERGRRVPEEISVVGFDDVPESAYYVPPLTTIRPDFVAVAREGLALLLDQITTGQPATAQRRAVTPTLVPRKSVGPPPG